MYLLYSFFRSLETWAWNDSLSRPAEHAELWQCSGRHGRHWAIASASVPLTVTSVAFSAHFSRRWPQDLQPYRLGYWTAQKVAKQPGWRESKRSKMGKERKAQIPFHPYWLHLTVFSSSGWWNGLAYFQMRKRRGTFCWDVGMPCFKCCNMLRSSAPPGCRLPNLVFSVSHWNWFAMIQIWKNLACRCCSDATLTCVVLAWTYNHRHPHLCKRRGSVMFCGVMWSGPTFMWLE